MRYPTITSSGGIQGPSVSAHKNTHTLFLALSLSLVYPVISVNKRQTLLCSDRTGGFAFHCFKSGKMLPSDEWGFLELRAMKLYTLSFTGLFFTLLLWNAHTHTQTAFLSLVIPSPCSLPFSLRFHPLFSAFFPAHRDGRPRSVSKLLSRPIPLHTNVCQNWFAVFLLCLSNVFPY